MIPTALIVLPFIAALLLNVWQYHAIDARRRILNLRFLLSLGAVVAILFYVFHAFNYPDDRPTSWIFFALAIIWLAIAWFLLRRMPPRETY